jgi:hypothetical protein
MKQQAILFSLCALAALPAAAQNLQVHYDFGRRIYSSEEATRQNVTLTFEQFRPDAAGSWFWFIDLDMYHDGMKGAYTEISREFTFYQSDASAGKGWGHDWAAHVELDAGETTFRSGGLGARFQNAALVGPAWNGHTRDYRTTWSLQAMYKQYFKRGSSPAYASAQLTGVWSWTSANAHWTTSGYVDLWRGRQTNGHGQLIVMSEPQGWYHITPHCWVGTEVELSNNFVQPEDGSSRTFYVNPTLAVKWNF